MIKLLAFAAALVLAVAATVFATSKSLYDAEDVISLTLENFDSVIKDYATVLVMFKSETCGHCKRALPEFKKLGSEFAHRRKMNESTDTHVATVECPEQHDVCKNQEVSAYPTFKVYRGKNSYPVNAVARTAEGFTSVLERFFGPALQDLPEKEKDAIKKHIEKKFDEKEHEKPKIPEKQGVLYVPRSAPLEKEVEAEISRMLDEVRISYHTRRTHEAALVGQPDSLAKPYLRVYDFEMPGEHIDFDFTDKDDPAKVSLAGLSAFLKHATLAPVGEIARENHHVYESHKVPLMYYLYETQEDRAEATKVLGRISRSEYRMNFGLLDAKQFGEFGQQHGLEVSWPAALVMDAVNAKKYALQGDKAKLTKGASHMEEFVSRIMEGKQEKLLKSEPIPETNDEPVLKVVSRTFDELVLRKYNEDVFVLVHAYWCGHCKQIMPTYQRLGKALRNITTAIVPAMIDGSLNDIPESGNIKVSGFPTLVLYPGVASASEQKAPVHYHGDRSFESMMEFLQKHAYHKVKLQEADPKDLRISDDELLMHDGEL